MQFELTKEFLETVELAIEEKDTQFLIETFNEEMYAADIAQVLYELNNEQCIYLVSLLDTDQAAEVISHVDDETRKSFLKNFDSEKIAIFLKYIDSDDAVDLVNELAVKEREEVIAFIEKFDKEKAAHILDLLRYDEGTAGAIMAKELIKANINWTIKQCIEELRKQSEQSKGKASSVYVVDDEERLLGRLSLKKMIIANDKTLVKDIFDEDVFSVESYLSTDEVVDMMEKYDLVAIPVVNIQNRLIGRITIDDVVDIIQDRAEKDRQAMTGISDDIEEDDSIWKLSKARLPWLLIGMFGGLLGAKFIGLFESQLLLVPAMAFFIPLITATGGNVGVQSSSIIVQSLANKTFFADNIGLRLFKVFLVAIVNGLAISVLVFLFVMFLGQGEKLALVVSLALLFVTLLASLMGTITPLILDRFGINPAMASGPFITTANDLLGLAVYFATASLLFHI